LKENSMPKSKASASKVALITGASRGIGKAIAAHLALQGYQLTLAARSVRDRDVTPFPGTIMETAALVESLGATAFPVRCDIESADDIRNAVDKTLEHFGRIDLMINNARYEGPAHWEALAAVDINEMDKLFAANLRAPLHFCKRVVPQMGKQGGGMVINVTSASATLENPNMPGAGSTSLFYQRPRPGSTARCSG